MDTSMVERVQEKHWYLAVGDRSIGPLTTALVTRGIESGKVPLTAWICQVGANSWSALSSFGEFQDVVDRVLSAGVPANQQNPQSPATAGYQESEASPSASPVSTTRESQPQYPADQLAVDETQTIELPNAFASAVQADRESADAALPQLAYEVSDALPSFADVVTSATLPLEIEREFAAVARDELPSVDEQSGEREAFAAPQALPESPHTGDHHELHDDLGIDITFEEDAQNAVEWNERFQSYFLVGTKVELPEETQLLQSLAETPRAVFLHDEALWNLSLCLAFGSDQIAAASARTFFDAIASDQASERVEWICRTLLSKGFMPSGIPRAEGMRGIEFLRMSCPAHLADVLEREALD
jgi:hypothetical protein